MINSIRKETRTLQPQLHTISRNASFLSTPSFRRWIDIPGPPSRNRWLWGGGRVFGSARRRVDRRWALVCRFCSFISWFVGPIGRASNRRPRVVCAMDVIGKDEPSLELWVEGCNGIKEISAWRRIIQSHNTSLAVCCFLGVVPWILPSVFSGCSMENGLNSATKPTSCRSFGTNDRAVPTPRGPLQIGRGRSEERAEVVFVSSTPLRSGQLSGELYHYHIICS